MFNTFSKIKAHWSQTVAVLTASLGVISNGMEFGWASPAIPKLQSQDSPVTIDDSDIYWLQMLYTIGGVFGLPVTFILLQYVGRKQSLLFMEALSMICWILVATSSFGSVIPLYVARFFSGLAAIYVYVAVPMYTAEVTEPYIRGFLGSVPYTMNTFGVVLVYSIVPYIPVYASAILAGSINLLMLLTFCWQPESPYFLLMKSKPEAAEKELRKLRSSDNVTQELLEMSSAVTRQNSEKGRPIDLVLIPSNLRATLIMTLLISAQNLCGMTVIVMNAQLILESGGSTIISAEFIAIIFAVTMLISTIIGASLIDVFGRKFLLISSSVCTSILLGTISAFFLAKDVYKVETTGYEWILFVATIGYAFAFIYGMGLVPIVVTAELFSIKVKSMGLVLSDTWYTAMAAISLEIYHASVDSFGMCFPFALFCIFGVLTTILVIIFVPETKGKTMEEIQLLLKGNDPTKKEDAENVPH